MLRPRLLQGWQVFVPGRIYGALLRGVAPAEWRFPPWPVLPSSPISVLLRTPPCSHVPPPLLSLRSNKLKRAPGILQAPLPSCPSPYLQLIGPLGMLSAAPLFLRLQPRASPGLWMQGGIAVTQVSSTPGGLAAARSTRSTLMGSAVPPACWTAAESAMATA